MSLIVSESLSSPANSISLFIWTKKRKNKTYSFNDVLTSLGTINFRESVMVFPGHILDCAEHVRITSVKSSVHFCVHCPGLCYISQYGVYDCPEEVDLKFFCKSILYFVYPLQFVAGGPSCLYTAVSISEHDVWLPPVVFLLKIVFFRWCRISRSKNIYMRASDMLFNPKVTHHT